jgi:large subunit ribosomal protein L22
MAVKGLRKHRGPRYGIVQYKYCHYYVRLEEGEPIEYNPKVYESFEERARKYIEYLRERRITNRA